MFTLIYQFFSTVVFQYNSNAMTYPLYQKLFIDTTFDIGGQSYRALEYYSFICAFIGTAVIVVLCCWFIKKIINIIFRLFTGSSAF